MISFEPSIVFIDDKIDQVKGIIDLYRHEGVGVRFFNADVVDGDDHPESQYSNVNLIYLDLFYKDDFDLDLCLGWIDGIIRENSFYILVIWSKDTQYTDDIIQGLASIGKEPFICFSETKNDDYKNSDNTFKWKELKQKIDKELSKIPELDELSIWKKSVFISSNNMIGHLVKGVKGEDLRIKLQKIIVGHGGTSFLGNDKIEQKREILFDAFDNILLSNSKLSRIDRGISEHNINNLYNIKQVPNSDVDSKLNSWFHFMLQNPIPESTISPGLICSFNNDSLIRNYNIQRDATIADFLSIQIKGTDEIKPNFVDIAIVISRPCDVAQNKYGRNLKLLSGVLIINPIRRKNRLKSKMSTPASLKIFEHLYLNDEQSDCSIIFDFRYSFSLPPEIFHQRFEKMKIFNKELLSEIQVEYSSYSSRLGITQVI